MSDEFRFRHFFHISGLSSESLSAYSEEYAQAGKSHMYLLKFVKLPEKNTNIGSVFRSFINAVKIYLKHFHDEIISIQKVIHTFTAISLYSNLKLLMDQIK